MRAITKLAYKSVSLHSILELEHFKRVIIRPEQYWNLERMMVEELHASVGTWIGWNQNRKNPKLVIRDDIECEEH